MEKTLTPLQQIEVDSVDHTGTRQIAPSLQETLLEVRQTPLQEERNKQTRIRQRNDYTMALRKFCQRIDALSNLRTCAPYAKNST